MSQPPWCPLLQCSKLFSFFIPLPQARTNPGHIPLSSHCTRHSSLPHHAPILTHIYSLGGYSRQVWQKSGSDPWNLADEMLPSCSEIYLWAICMIITMGGSPFCSHRGCLTVRYLPWLPTHPRLVFQCTHLQQISTQALVKNHHPSSTVCQHTPAPPFPHRQFSSFCKKQLTSPTHNLVILFPPPSLHVNFVAIRENKFGFSWQLSQGFCGGSSTS